MKKGSVTMIKKEAITLIAQRKPDYNEVMKELINLTEEAIKEKNYIIHYGI